MNKHKGEMWYGPFFRRSTALSCINRLYDLFGHKCIYSYEIKITQISRELKLIPFYEVSVRSFVSVISVIRQCWVCYRRQVVAQQPLSPPINSRQILQPTSAYFALPIGWLCYREKINFPLKNVCIFKMFCFTNTIIRCDE